MLRIRPCYGNGHIVCQRLRHFRQISNQPSKQPILSLPTLSPLEEAFVREQTQLLIEPQCLIEASAIARRNGHENIWTYEPALVAVLPTLPQLTKMDYVKPLYWALLRGGRSKDLKQIKYPWRVQQIYQAQSLTSMSLEDIAKTYIASTNVYLLIKIEMLSQLLGVSSKEALAKRHSIATTPLTREQTRKIIEITINTLGVLTLDDEAQEISRVCCHSNGPSNQPITLSELWCTLGQITLQGIARRKNIDFNAKTAFRDISSSKLTWMRINPIEVARNYYLSEQLSRSQHALRFRRSPSGLMFPGQLLRYVKRDPLEVIISLSSLHANAAILDSQLKEKDAFLSFLAKGPFNDYLRENATSYPITFKRLTLQAIGFKDSEILEILFLTNDLKCQEVKFDGVSPGSKPLTWDSLDFVPIMRQRLELLKSDGIGLGIISVEDTWRGLRLWNEVIEKASSSSHKKVPEHLMQSQSITKTHSPSSSKKVPSVKCLIRHFGDELKPRTVRFVERHEWFSRVQASTVEHNVVFLTEKGFTKEHLRDCIQLLFYPNSLIDQKLKEICENQPYEFSEPSKVLLHVCLYHIEKEFNFSNENFFVPRSNIFTPSVKFSKAIRTWTRPSKSCEPEETSFIRLYKKSRQSTSSTDFGKAFFEMRRFSTDSKVSGENS